MIEGECRNRDHKEGAPKLTLIPYSLLGACRGNLDGNDMSVAGNISWKRDRYGYRSEYTPSEILIMVIYAPDCKLRPHSELQSAASARRKFVTHGRYRVYRVALSEVLN